MPSDKTSLSIYQKLFKVQSENLKFKKTAENPFYHSKYLPLDGLLETLAPSLARYELLIIHATVENKVITEVRNVGSDDFVRSEFPLQPNLDPQKVGSAISYAKRYNISQLFNIITDEDDDGNAQISHKTTTPSVSTPKKVIPPIANTLPSRNEDLGVCDICGENALLSKAGKPYCPTWKTHRDENVKYQIVPRRSAIPQSSASEPMPEDFLSDVPFKD